MLPLHDIFVVAFYLLMWMVAITILVVVGLILDVYLITPLQKWWDRRRDQLQMRRWWKSKKVVVK